MLDANDSIVVDARNYAASLVATSHLKNITNITLIGGDGTDTFYLPNFTQYNYKAGSNYLVDDFIGFKKIITNVNLGSGDDTLVLTVEKFSSTSATNRYDGGSDTAGSGPDGLGHGDTLKIEGANREINLSNIGKYFSNIEQVDLGANHDDGSGKYTFTLTLDSMLKLSNSRDDLVINGGSDDQIKITDSANWTQKGDAEIAGKQYHVYANSNNEDQKIYVQSDIIVDLS